MLGVAVDVVRLAQHADAQAAEWQSGPGAQPPPVAGVGDLRVGLFGGEGADLFDDRGRSTPQIRGPERQWTLDLAGRATPPANGHPDHVVAQQGNVLDKQPQHPLAVARRRARVMPDARQVGDQRRHALLHLGSHRRERGLACTGVRLFGRSQSLQRLVPVPFEAVGHEPILAPHEKKLPLRQLGILPKPGNLRPLGAVDLGGPGSQLVEHLDRDVERRRGDGFEHKVADRAVDRRARQALARRLRPLNPPALTAIERLRVTVRHDVADSHAAAAPTADDEPLQQGYAFAWRAAPTVCADALGAYAQPPPDSLRIAPR